MEDYSDDYGMVLGECPFNPITIYKTVMQAGLWRFLNI